MEAQTDSIARASGFKGILILRISYGDGSLGGGPDFGEPLLYFGDRNCRNSDFYEDDYICFRIGKDNGKVFVTPGDALFYEGFDGVEPGTEEWIAWLNWCLKKFHSYLDEYE